MNTETQSTNLSTPLDPNATPLLNAALAKAQGSMQNAEKDRTNPHFKSKYATLASSFDACRTPLSENGLSLFQNPETIVEGVKTVAVRCITELRHSSGERLVSSPIMIPVAAPNGAQQIGSAISYARRYQMQAMIGIAAAEDDDDGNAAQGDPNAKGASTSQTSVPTSPNPSSRPQAKAKPVQKPQTAVDLASKPGVTRALQADQDRHAAPEPPPNWDADFNQSFPEGDPGPVDNPVESVENSQPVTLLDQLLAQVDHYQIPAEKMPDMIFKAIGKKKRAKDLDSNETQKVINTIKLLWPEPKPKA